MNSRNKAPGLHSEDIVLRRSQRCATSLSSRRNRGKAVDLLPNRLAHFRNEFADKLVRQCGTPLDHRCSSRKRHSKV